MLADVDLRDEGFRHIRRLNQHQLLRGVTVRKKTRDTVAQWRPDQGKDQNQNPSTANHGNVVRWGQFTLLLFIVHLYLFSRAVARALDLFKQERPLVPAHSE